jgi:hypothetical protein
LQPGPGCIQAKSGFGRPILSIFLASDLSSDLIGVPVDGGLLAV